jgi:hypothetical protein
MFASFHEASDGQGFAMGAPSVLCLPNGVVNVGALPIAALVDSRNVCID